MHADLLDLITDLYDCQGIQVVRLSPPYQNLQDLDYGFRMQMFEDFDYGPIIANITQRIEPGILYHIEEDLKLFYTVARMPERLEEEYGARYLFIGPVMFHPLTVKEFQELADEKHIPPELYTQVQEFYNRIPYSPSFDTWSTTASTLLSRLLGSQPESRILTYKDSSLTGMVYEDYHIQNAPEVAVKAIEERYALEDEMIRGVAAGNMEQALAAHYKFSQYKLLPRTPDPVRNCKNMFIILNTLMRKAAQSGRVHPLHIDQLSTQIALQIESASTMAQLEAIPMMVIRKYCMLVRNHSRKAYSALVETCLDHIDFHYMEDLSLDSLSKMCAVSNSYLSTLFKKEVGATLTDYINSTRIRQSLILLNTTALTIQEIAIRCGFSDSNYFTRTFKKFHGQSPKGYREMIRRKV